MPVPSFDAFFVPVLKALEDGETRKTSEIYELTKKIYPLDEESYKERISSGDYRYNDRVSWAMTYLRKGELIQSPKFGYQVITKLGLAELRNGPTDFRVKYLIDKYPKIREYHYGTKTNNEPDNDISTDTPADMIEKAMTDLNESLADELMREIYKERDWSYFEKLVLKVMSSLGYGYDSSSIEWTGKPGDEGIDGVIYEDKLGFDRIFIQAKHYGPNTKVNDAEIRNFIGSMDVKEASKGVLITTSTFTKNARELASNKKVKLKLIDGRELVNLMIENNIGVSTSRTYAVKRIDIDFFDNI